jgi:hypothetical protein
MNEIHWSSEAGIKKVSHDLPQHLEFESRGQWKGVAFKNTAGMEEMHAFVWVDRDGPLFI